MSSIQALKAQREELVAHGLELELEIGFQPTFEQRLALRSVTSQLQAIDRKLEEAQMGDFAVRTPMYGSGSGDPNDSLTPGEAFVQSPAYQQWIQQHPSGGPSYGDSRSEVDNALHWLVELYLSGEEWWAWRQLVIATSEECGPAWPEGPATIEALYGMWRMTSDPLHAVDATIRLCRAPKSRIADDALAAHLMGHQREMARPTPDEALDVHTVAGRYKLGRTEDSETGQQHWWYEAAKLANKVDDPEADHHEQLVRRWWSEHRSYPEARKPKEHQKPPVKDYALPLGTVHEGDTVRIPASEPDQGPWVVNLTNQTCSCPAFKRWPPCKHLKATKALKST